MIFFDKVTLMRRLQQEYFKTRSKSVLEKCKVVEKEVDVGIKRVNAIIGNLQNEQSLFR